MGLFSGRKSISIAPPPTFARDPQLWQAINSGLGWGNQFINQNNLPSSLQEAISTDPRVTQLAIESLKSQLAPELRTAQQDITNTLEANNQLTGSTTASALGNLQSDYLSKLTSAGSQAMMADISRALNARLGLANTGIGAIGQSGQLALGSQGQENQFNLSNYENIIAKTLAEQKPQSGGIIGALTGGVGGALAGSTFGPWGALVGGLSGAAAGGFGQQGTGGSFLTAGAGVAGSRSGQGGFNWFSPQQSSQQGVGISTASEQILDQLRSGSGVFGRGLGNLYPGKN